MDFNFEENFSLEIEKAQEKYWQLLTEVFEQNNAGKDLLEKWEKWYLYSPNLPPLSKARDYPDYYPYLREGENRFVRKILADLANYKKYKADKIEKEKTNDRNVY